MSVIEFENVSKRYRLGSARGSLRDTISDLFTRLVGKREREQDQCLWALKDLSFDVERGETLGIVGPNGAGKTTILKLLSNVTNPTRGHIRVDGKVAALIELGAGFHPDLTGRENIYLNAAVLGLRKDEVKEKFDSIVEFSELESFIDTPVKRYSSGMYVRLGFSVAAHVDPDILLIDEVLAVGDYAFQDKCIARLDQLQEESKTLVIVSHDRQKIERLCDKAILLRKGEIVSQGDVNEVLRHYYEMRGEAMKAQAENTWEVRRSEYVSVDRELEILDVTMVDRLGNERHTFESGELAIVRITFRTISEVHNPVFYVRIFRDDGLWVHGTNTARSNLSVDLEAHVHGVMDLRYDSLALLDGSYRLSVGALRSYFSPLAYDEIEGAYHFVVQSTVAQGHGVVLIPHTWQLLDQRGIL